MAKQSRKSKDNNTEILYPNIKMKKKRGRNAPHKEES